MTMATKLSITFAGICLLERDEAEQRLHVLLPEERMGHQARLIFKDGTGTLQKCDITREHIDLTAHTGTTPLDLTLPTEVFDFETSPYKRMGKKPIPPDEVRAKVSLAAGKHGGTLHKGGCWDIDKGTVTKGRFATALGWEIDGLNLSELELDLTTSKVRIPAVGDTISLMIVHVVTDELDGITTMDIPSNTKCPEDGEELDHLQLYFPLLDPPDLPSKSELPKFNKSDSQAAGVVCPPHAPGFVRNAKSAESLMSGSELTCTLATVRAG